MNRAHLREKLSIKSIFSLCLISTAFSLASPVQGQITPDNTLSSEASRLNQNLIIKGAPGDEIEGGAKRGSNLFHSFSEFNIQDGQRVYFANPSGVENILTRVTGGNASNIFGTLGVAGAANLFLINPRGIVFGQNAQLDLQGSFVGTTANGVQFGNQELFSATNPQTPSLLTVNVPVGLQYGSNPVAIQVQGASLQVPNGQNLTLAGGALNIDGTKLLAPGGRVELGGVSAAGTVGLNSDGSLSFPDNLARADVSIINDAEVDVRAGGGGSITVNARNLEVTEGSQLAAGIRKGLGTPEAQAGDVTIRATDWVKFDGVDKDGYRSGASSRVESGAEGNAGGVSITTGSLELTNGAFLDASTLGKGDAGSVTITAKDAIKFDGVDKDGYRSGAFSTVGSGAKGNAGRVSITTGSLELTNGALLDASTFSTVEPRDVGKGGGIQISADSVFLTNNAKVHSLVSGVGNSGGISIDTGSLTVASYSELNSSIVDGGKGQAGDIIIKARDLVLFDGGFAFSRLEKGGRGRGGDIRITTDESVLVKGIPPNVAPSQIGQLVAATFGDGDAGSITIKAGNNVSFVGKGSDAYTLVAQDKGVGNAGNIMIDSRSLSIMNGARLVAITENQGNAGSVIINAHGRVSFDHSAALSYVGKDAVGKGGNIKISADSVSVTNAAQLEASTSGKGDAGSVDITTGFLEVSNGAKLSANSQGEGIGGNIELAAGSLTLDQGTISTETRSNTGGDITLNLQDLLLLRNGSKISTNAGTDFAPGNGGNITISGKFIVAIPNENSDISANAFSGNGGTITINNLQGIFGIEKNPKEPQKSGITAISVSGFPGVININQRDNSSIQNSFTQLSPNVIDTNALIANSCISRGNQRQENSFTITGSGALRNSPGDVLISTYTTGEVRNVNPTPRPWKKGDPIIEAQGLYQLPDGQLILSRDCS